MPSDRMTREDLITKLVHIDVEFEQYWAYGHYDPLDFLAACYRAECEAKSGIEEDEIGPPSCVEHFMVTLQNAEMSTNWIANEHGDIPVTRLQW